MELYKIGKRTYYIKNNTNIGIYKLNENDIAKYSEKLDKYLRELLNLSELYELDKNKIDEYFLNLLMKWHMSRTS